MRMAALITRIEVSANRSRNVACGVASRMSHDASSLCRAATAALEALQRDSGLVQVLARHAAANAVPLEGYDVLKRCFVDGVATTDEVAMVAMARKRATRDTITPVLALEGQLEELTMDGQVQTFPVFVPPISPFSITSWRHHVTPRGTFCLFLKGCSKAVSNPLEFRVLASFGTMIGSNFAACGNHVVVERRGSYMPGPYVRAPSPKTPYLNTSHFHTMVS